MSTGLSDTRQRAVSQISWLHWCCRGWERIVQLALILWVVRVPLVMTALGLLILSSAPQAQDLFVEFAHNAWRIPLFLLLLFFAWAMPTHYAARLLLDTDVRFQNVVAAQQAVGRVSYIEAVERGLPRALGLLTFLAVLIAIWRSHLNLPIFSEPGDKEAVAATNRVLGLLAVLVSLAAVGFLIYAVKRPRNADIIGLRTLKNLNRRLAPQWNKISPGSGTEESQDADASRNVGRFLLLVSFIVFLAIFLGGADSAARLAPRSMAVPFILGGWLPFLSYLSAAGRQLRAPLIVGLFASTSLLAVVLGDNHSVRLIDASKTAGYSVDVTPLPFQEAVSIWMRENKCEATPANCPRPIIVAAAGGASRAAFFLASIIGYFMQEAPSHDLDANKVRNRLFGISGVSGGSMGAVMVAAALNAKADSNDHPCVQSSFQLWWGQQINNWRDCFETLTSGDFLSADFFGFAFNDMFPFAFRDRAAVLEDTWNHRFRSAVLRADESSSLSCKGLNCPFLTLRPREGHWIPLLVLNGTSEATGGRIVTTLLAKTYEPASNCPTSLVSSGCTLFVDADRFHDLLDYKAETGGWLGAFQRAVLNWRKRDEVLDDVRLDTAAHNSARFPFISPAGSIRNQDQVIVDRIVDGGYFENYGALSAKELALAIHAVQPALAPVVVVISNDPNDPLNQDADVVMPDIKATIGVLRNNQEKKARAAVNGAEPVTDIVAPLVTAANTRTAHGILGVDELSSALREAIPGCQPYMIPVRVWPQPLDTSDASRPVSMSWWLSTLVQRHLHQQTELRKNDNQNGPRLQEIWNVMKAFSSCAISARLPP
jgi:hypothetical protein